MRKGVKVEWSQTTFSKSCAKVIIKPYFISFPPFPPFPPLGKVEPNASNRKGGAKCIK